MGKVKEKKRSVSRPKKKVPPPKEPTPPPSDESEDEGVEAELPTPGSLGAEHDDEDDELLSQTAAPRQQNWAQPEKDEQVMVEHLTNFPNLYLKVHPFHKNLNKRDASYEKLGAMIGKSGESKLALMFYHLSLCMPQCFPFFIIVS